MFARASAFAEVIELLDSKKLETGIEALTKRMKEGEHNYKIGGSKDVRPKTTPTT